MGADELAELAEAAAENRRAIEAAEVTAERQRTAIFAALDAGHSITETYRTAGISRGRINQLIQQRNKGT